MNLEEYGGGLWGTFERGLEELWKLTPPPLSPGKEAKIFRGGRGNSGKLGETWGNSENLGKLGETRGHPGKLGSPGTTWGKLG